MMHLTNDQIIDYMHAALSPQQDAAAYEHMESCPECRAEYDAELALTDMLRAHAREEERDLPPTLKAEIWSRVRTAQPSFWAKLVRSLRPPATIPVAAALALAAYFGSLYAAPHGAPSIEAAYYLQDHAALNNTVPFSDRSAAPAELIDSSAPVDNQQSAVTVPATEYMADASR